MTDADIEAVLKLNAHSVWALSPMDADDLQLARERAALALVCELDGAVVAFTVVYAPGSTYESLNYAWHAERFDDFLYLDRIAVDPDFRRRGIANAIYDTVEAAAQPHGRLVCEVNSDPPNVESLAFHRARGFRELGHLTHPGGKQTVMLEKPL
jgi:predicted GNAT superfamily acetyltransferase